MAKGAFELPKQTMTNTQPGTFKPNGSFYQHPQTTSTQGVPNLNQSMLRSMSGGIPDIHPLPANVPAPHPPPNRLPPVRGSAMSGNLPNSGSQGPSSLKSTDLRSSVRSVLSMQSAVNSFQSLRKNSVLEISSVDNPTEVEETNLGESVD